MTAWKSWRKRKKYEPVIIEHAKELPKWRIAARILFERFMNYSTYRLVGWAAVGFVGIGFAYMQGLKWSQRKLYASPYIELALEKFKEQKKLVSLVGEPLKFGWIFPMYKGGIQDNSVDVVIPVEGSEAEGTILLEAHKTDDSWIVDDLSFQFVDAAGGVVQIIKK